MRKSGENRAKYLQAQGKRIVNGREKRPDISPLDRLANRGYAQQYVASASPSFAKVEGEDVTYPAE